MYSLTIELKLVKLLSNTFASLFFLNLQLFLSTFMKYIYILVSHESAVVSSEFPDTSVFRISFLVSAIIPIVSCEFTVISAFNSYRIQHYLHLLFLLRSISSERYQRGYPLHHVCPLFILILWAEPCFRKKIQSFIRICTFFYFTSTNLQHSNQFREIATSKDTRDAAFSN